MLGLVGWTGLGIVFTLMAIAALAEIFGKRRPDK